MTDSVWEEKAVWWRDTFASGEDPEYVEQILPLVRQHVSGAKAVLDLGTGEGQVARTASEVDAELVVGIDSSYAMTDEATRRKGDMLVVQGDVGALPFADKTFDAVTVCLVLEHIEDVMPVMDEVARVLKADGRFLILMNHPLLQTPGSGWIDDHILDEQYWRIGPYLESVTTMEEVEAGVHIPFVHRPLSSYVNGLARAGLMIVHMEEPAPPPGFIARADEYQGAASIPRLLFLRCEKRS